MTAGEDLAQAFEFISLLRIRHQHRQIGMGLAPDNYIHPRQLNSLELNNLKKICRLIGNLLDVIIGRYGIGAIL